MNQIWTSWRTTACAIGLIGVTVAFLFKTVTLEQYVSTIALLGAGGLALAKDAHS